MLVLVFNTVWIVSFLFLNAAFQSGICCYLCIWYFRRGALEISAVRYRMITYIAKRDWLHGQAFQVEGERNRVYYPSRQNAESE